MPRILEFFLVVLVGLAAAIVAVPVAFIVLISLGHPIFFAQVRSGQNGRVFKIRKFRTMRDLRLGDGRLAPDEDRQTPLSAILRRLRLDEIPQILAIVKGDMALVGPRPLLPETIDGFGKLGGLRGTVRPGLTGWAQVSGNTRLTGPEKLALDLWYVHNRSLWLDLRILAETVLVVIMGEHRRPDRIAQANTMIGGSNLSGCTP